MSDKHIMVTTVGTQYDEDHVVCMTKEAKSLLLDVLTTSSSILQAFYNKAVDVSEASVVEHYKRELDLSDVLADEIRNLPVCGEDNVPDWWKK